ncbi:MAG: DNA-formamidopyrimidine glycosylase family protein [Methanomassiliicoccus sp.]|nr:DNA-formamidopyrimidine glycosylase family protein [Methanomassiliicoccus sp.]
MPELPEVETFKRYIEARALRRRIVQVEVRNRTVLGAMGPEELERKVEGGMFLSVRRHGKQLFLELSSRGWLTWHFGMTGEPVLFEDDEVTRFPRVLFHFDRSTLAFDDPRMLGRIGWTEDWEEFVHRKGLGPDALVISKDDFAERFGRARGAIKPALLDQHRMAGIGNIYADEVLFQSRIDPRTEASALSREDLEAMHRIMRRVLRLSIDRGTDFSAFPRSYLLHHRSKGARCPGCGGTVRTTTLGGRTTYFCPACQGGRGR